MVTLVKDHGLQYLLATTVLAGLLQISAGFLKLGYVMRFVSRSVMTGFVNALAILIFMAQLPELMRTRLTDGEVQFRKAYLAALIERVEAGDDDIPIFGQKTVLEQQVANGSGAGPSVRSFVGRWRPVGDASK